MQRLRQVSGSLWSMINPTPAERFPVSPQKGVSTPEFHETFESALRQASQSPTVKARQWLDRPPRQTPLRLGKPTSSRGHRRGLSRTDSRGQASPLSPVPAGVRKVKKTPPTRQGVFSLAQLANLLPALAAPSPERLSSSGAHLDLQSRNDDADTPMQTVEDRRFQSPGSSWVNWDGSTLVGRSPSPPVLPVPTRSSELHPLEVDIFKGIGRMPFAPILPCHWQHAYPTFPASLFAAPHEIAPIRAFHPSPTADHRCQRAHTDLMALGSIIRSQYISRRKPEPRIIDTLMTYLNWALWDGGWRNLENALPMATIIGPSLLTHDFAGMTELLARRLRGLAEEWRQEHRIRTVTAPVAEQAYDESSPRSEYPRSDIEEEAEEEEERYKMADLPLLTGFLVYGSCIGIATFHARGLHKQKSVAAMDWSEPKNDVWNALLIGRILAVPREQLWRAGQDGVLGKELPLEPDVDL
ncbi:MAG: hypothetical protein M1814_005625 [Vezdaea aestivalis]|nr:MAG: hypothetical protein M1814_005625 [Vezdaea aestivalis]